MTQNKSMPKEHEVELVSSPGVQDSDVETYQAYDESEVKKELAELVSEDRGNLADEFGDAELVAEITQRVSEDETSMKPYIKRYDRALALARMTPDDSDKTFPFVGASKIMMSGLIEGALDFWARSYPIVVERKQIAMAEIYGTKSPEKIERADRATDFLNYDLRKGIKNWRDDQSKALLTLPITGTYYKKTWHDSISGKRKSQLLFADDLICDHSKSNFDHELTKSYRYKLSKSSIRSYILTDVFIDFDYDEEDETQTDLTFLESHCWLDLDEDGITEPYIAIICEEKNELVSLVPRFDIDDVTVTEEGDVVAIKAEDQFTITTFIPDPSGSFLGMGWGILLGDSFETINTAARQLLDAGTIQNTGANSGFISVGRNGPRGRTRKGKQSLVMGQFTGVEMDNIGQNIWQPSFMGPSPTLYQLMVKLTEDLQRTVSTGQQTEANPGEAAELFLARLQQGLKLPTAIMVNVYNGISRELERLHEIYKDYLEDEEYQSITGSDATVEEDFGMPDLDLQLTADPTQGSEEERIAKSKIVLDEAKAYPGHDIRKAYTDYYTAIGVANIDEILPEPEPEQPDPLLIIQSKVAEAEQMTAAAEKMKALASMIKAQVEMMKAESEIENTESETLKNLSEVDRNELQGKITLLKSNLEAARGMFNDASRIFETDSRANAEMAKITAGQGAPSSNQSPVPSAGGPTT